MRACAPVCACSRAYVSVCRLTCLRACSRVYFGLPVGLSVCVPVRVRYARVCRLTCLRACLPVCVPAFLAPFVCVPVRLFPACQRASLPVCVRMCVYVGLPVCVPVRVRMCVYVGLPSTCWLTCLRACSRAVCACMSAYLFACVPKQLVIPTYSVTFPVTAAALTVAEPFVFSCRVQIEDFFPRVQMVLFQDGYTLEFLYLQLYSGHYSRTSCSGTIHFQIDFPVYRFRFFFETIIHLEVLSLQLSI